MRSLVKLLNVLDVLEDKVINDALLNNLANYILIDLLSKTAKLYTNG